MVSIATPPGCPVLPLPGLFPPGLAPTSVAPARVAAELGLPWQGSARVDPARVTLPSPGCPVRVPRLLTSPTQELFTFSATASSSSRAGEASSSFSMKCCFVAEQGFLFHMGPRRALARAGVAPASGVAPRQGRPCVALAIARVAPATPRRQGCPPPALARPRSVGRPGPRCATPARSCQQRPSWAREALAPAGGRAFRAWPSPFCHMNELGSRIGLEGVLNTVWVVQLPVDPGKCIGSSNSSSQHVPPRPAGRLEV